MRRSRSKLDRRTALESPPPSRVPPAPTREAVVASDRLSNPPDGPPGDDVSPHELVRPPLWDRAVSLAAVVIPFVALGVAIVLMWGRGVDWIHIWMLIAGYLLTTFGITVGYHRLFTHKAFRTNSAVRATLGVLGSMAAQGPVLRWVATHRRHHRHSDDENDPHSPHFHGGGVTGMVRGIYHAHMGWFFTPGPADMSRYIPDLKKDPVVSWVSRLFVLWVALGLAVPALIGLAVTGTGAGAALGLLWGGLVRILLVQHVTWSVNSVCHLWGTRRFRSKDHSRNNLIFGLLALGEGWHHNHHAFPTSARHGLRWWELDLSYLFIRLMGSVGLASDIRVPDAERMADKLTQRVR